MNKNVITGIFSVLLMIVSISCSNDDIPLDDYIIRKLNGSLYLPTFQNGMTWDEITYPTEDISKYILNHYEINSETLATGEIINYLFKDSVIIGSITKTDDRKIYFTKVNSNNKELLYDFSNFDPRYGGLGYGSYDGLSLYKDLPRKGDDYAAACDYSYTWGWMYDKYGGITINGAGSTAGILSSIDPLGPGLSRKVIRIYNKYYSKNHNDRVDLWLSFNYNNMDFCIYNGWRVYHGDYNELYPYLPLNFWIGIGDYHNLLELGLITQDDYDNILQLYKDARYKSALDKENRSNNK